MYVYISYLLLSLLSRILSGSISIFLKHLFLLLVHRDDWRQLLRRCVFNISSIANRLSCIRHQQPLITRYRYLACIYYLCPCCFISLSDCAFLPNCLLCCLCLVFNCFIVAFRICVCIHIGQGPMAPDQCNRAYTSHGNTPFYITQCRQHHAPRTAQTHNTRHRTVQTTRNT